VPEGCEVKYSNTGAAIPYVALRIGGFQNGLNGVATLQSAEEGAGCGRRRTAGRRAPVHAFSEARADMLFGPIVVC
jgi:hypothetical protein